MFLAGAYVHDLDPFALRISGSFGVRWYGLAYAATFLLGWLLLRWLARSRRSSLSVDAAGDLLFYMIAGVLLGGRLGYAVFYKPALFVTLRDNIPFWDLLAIHEGGMSSHGGMIGVIIACVLFVRRHKVSALHLLDLMAWICPIGFGLGRFANFVNGELWGRALPAAMQTYATVTGAAAKAAPGWSIKYPGEPMDADHAWTAATPAVDARMNALQQALGDRFDTGPDFLERVVSAARAGERTVLDALVPQLTAHYPSQLIQCFVEGPLVWGVLTLVWLRPRRPGVIGATWLVAYGVGRILTEAYRQPDAPLTLGLTRGQALSVLMVVAGIVSIVVCSRRAAEPTSIRRPHV